MNSRIDSGGGARLVAWLVAGGVAAWLSAAEPDVAPASSAGTNAPALTPGANRNFADSATVSPDRERFRDRRSRRDPRQDVAPLSDRRSSLAPGALSSTGREAAPTSTGTGSFDDFRIIYERNIFNPSRRPIRRGGQPDVPLPVKIDTFTLVGILISTNGAYAFFDGSDSRFRTVLQPAGAIGGFILLEITPDCVRLGSMTSTNKSPIQMVIRQQMRRQDEGEWQLSGAPPDVAVSSDGSAGPSDSGNSDVVQRLMLRRQQEESGPATNTVAAPPAPTAVPAATTASTEGSADDVVKRLMQKREQELNK